MSQPHTLDDSSRVAGTVSSQARQDRPIARVASWLARHATPSGDSRICHAADWHRSGRHSHARALLETGCHPRRRQVPVAAETPQGSTL